MARLTRAQAEARRRILRLAESGLPVEPLSQGLLQVLLESVPADAGALFAVDPATLLFTRLLAASGGAPGHIAHWLREVYLTLEPEAFTFPALIAAGRGAVALQDRAERCWGLPVEAFARYGRGEWRRLYHDLGSPPGGGLRAYYSAGNQPVAALQLARYQSNRPIRPEERITLSLLAPALGRALAAALLREQAHQHAGRYNNAPATAMVVLAADGRIVMQTPSAETWFRALACSRAGAAQAGSLPTVVWAARAALRAGRDREVVHAALQTSTIYGPLRVEASPLDQKNGQTAVVLALERPPALPTIPSDWPLTAQERKIMALVALGMSNRQIAQQLFVSENTVETHLVHAYGKLGIHSRTQFLACLFRHARWPLQA